MKSRNTKILVILLGVGLVLLGVVLFQKNLRKQDALSESDSITAQNLIDTSSKIRSYYQANQKLPENLQIISSQNSVTYHKQSDKVYKLCDTFNNQLKPLLDEYDAHNAPNEIGTINYHSKGTDCFKVTLD